jgi:hypothetical protein
MQNHSLDDLVIKPQPLTGRMRSFIPVAPWLDGASLSDANLDGVQLAKVGSTYYREAYPTGETHRVNVIELGLVPDGVTDNSATLSDAMRRLPKNTTFFFPAANLPYLFGPLPTEHNNLDGYPVAINCDTSGAWFVGEGNDSKIQLKPGTAGFQVTAGLAPRITVFRDLDIIGAGRGAAGDGVEADGSPSEDFGKYRGNGINAYGQVLLDNVNVGNCSGHGVKIFGFSTKRISGLPFTLRGRMEQGGYGEFYFYPDDKAAMAKLDDGWKVRYQDKDTSIASREYNFPRLGIAPVAGITPANPAEIEITPVGGKLIADNGDIFGGNYDYNAGCGIYIQGDDANQTRIWGGSMRENGYWGLLDYSFLGTICTGMHFTRNGTSFNQTELKVGPYCTVDTNARSAYFGVYTEANQAPALIKENTQVIGGIQGAGVNGPGFTLLGQYANNLRAGNVHFNELGMLFYDNGGQPLTFRQWSWGIGFGFGNPENGQDPHEFLSFVGEGSVVNTFNRYDTGRKVKVHGVSIPTLYQGPFCHLAAGSLYEAIQLMNPDTQIIQQDTVTLYNGSNINTKTPLKYVCYQGGTPSTAKWRPEGYGIGSEIMERPAASALSVNDIGWRWYDPATNQYTTYNGTQWG